MQQPDASTSTARPKMARSGDSELLMSYYQSPLADQGYRRPAHRRSTSGNSTSSSDYSTEDSSQHSFEPHVQPRETVPSQGGADRRRLAIVQIDSANKSNKPATVRSRRGLATRLDGLALVAPPDAAPKSYAYLNQPSSAPPTAHQHSDHKSHTRSASDATTDPPVKPKPPRDVGIVGTAIPPSEQPKRPRVRTALVPPVFQEPHSSRASSPNTAHLVPPQPQRRSTDLSVHTPEIGQAKEIHVPVASPVIVDLGPDASRRVGTSSFDRRSPALQVVEPRSPSPLPLSAYLHYQPGVHATAGPLPPPPRAIFNIDPSTPPPPRPPRLGSPPPRRRADNQALQLPTSALPSSGFSTPTSTSRSISPAQPIDLASSGSGDEYSNDEALHRREGAFSPSTILTTTPSTSPSDYSPATAHPVRTIDGLIPNVSDGSKGSGSSGSVVASPVVIPAPPRMESLREHAGEEQWTYVNRDLTASPSSDGHLSQDRVSWESYSPMRSQEGGGTPSPPPKSFKASLTTGLKRFSSLPRTPSPSNKALSRSSSITRSRDPSPSLQPVALPSIPTPMPRRRKIIAQYPAALVCADVVARKSSQERCLMYAQKINELYVHDCGLGDWVLEAQLRGSKGPGKRATLAPSTQRAAPQPRHVSRSSMQSEATFPSRPDAMVATDLSTKPSDNAPVPTLPYPALSPRALAAPLPPPSLRTLPTSPPSKTGNFFASLGRKASASKRERSSPMTFASSSSSSGTTTRLVKSPPSTAANPRPVVISHTPSVPGGPRAPPNRTLRTQSIMSASPFSSNSSDRSSASAPRRPSLFSPVSSSSSESRSTRDRDRDFERQVDKLADLLPQAERAVLAGYLRRAGQDILAIGQFLEDEKNGTLRRD